MFMFNNSYLFHSDESTELWSLGSPVFLFQPPEPDISIEPGSYDDVKKNYQVRNRKLNWKDHSTDQPIISPHSASG